MFSNIVRLSGNWRVWMRRDKEEEVKPLIVENWWRYFSDSMNTVQRLGLSTKSTMSEVIARLRALIWKTFHPDKYAGLPERAKKLVGEKHSHDLFVCLQLLLSGIATEWTQYADETFIEMANSSWVGRTTRAGREE